MQAGMVSGKQLVAEMAHKRAEERKRFAQLEVSNFLLREALHTIIQI